TVASKLVARMTQVQITPQEMRVLRQVAEGKSNREIGETLFISEATVKIHLSHLFEKLGPSRRTALFREQRGKCQSVLMEQNFRIWARARPASGRSWTTPRTPSSCMTTAC